MRDFYFNDQLDATLSRYFETYAITKDTCDYVPENHLLKIHGVIFKNLRRELKIVRREYRAYRAELRAREKKYARELRRLQKKGSCGDDAAADPIVEQGQNAEI